MSLDRDIALLSRVPLFAELTTEQLRLLAFSAVRLELSPGQVLFREGTLAQKRRRPKCGICCKDPRSLRI